MNEKTRMASLSVASNSFLTLAKVVIGLVSGSFSILSEGIHSGIDLVAAFIALFDGDQTRSIIIDLIHNQAGR
ncbi:MAG: cation transporter [Desulfosporosinus sp.]|nr:cation transporter [Desulfosporosinus sp.]